MKEFTTVAEFRKTLDSLLSQYFDQSSLKKPLLAPEDRAKVDIELEALFASVPDDKIKDVEKSVQDISLSGKIPNPARPLYWLLIRSSKNVLQQLFSFYPQWETPKHDEAEKHDLNYLSSNPHFARQSRDQIKVFRDAACSPEGIAAAKKRREQLRKQPQASFLNRHGRKCLYLLGILVATFLLLIAFPPLGVAIPFIAAMPAGLASVLSAAIAWIMASAFHMVAAVVAVLAIGLSVAYIDRIPGLLAFTVGAILASPVFTLPALGLSFIAHLSFHLLISCIGYVIHGYKEAVPGESKPGLGKRMGLWCVNGLLMIFSGVLFIAIAPLAALCYGLSRLGCLILDRPYVHAYSAKPLHQGISSVVNRIKTSTSKPSHFPEIKPLHFELNQDTFKFDSTYVDDPEGSFRGILCGMIENSSTMLCNILKRPFELNTHRENMARDAGYDSPSAGP